jgi:acetoin utilization protein AcuB
MGTHGAAAGGVLERRVQRRPVAERRSRGDAMHWNRPTVEAFMTAPAIVVSPADPLSTAAHAMAVNRIRHLVVCDDGKIAGVLSQRDVFYTQAHRENEAEPLRVADAMTPFVYNVAPDALIEEVVRDIGDAKYGAAVVVQGDEPIGIFTTTDALSVLAEVLGDLRSRDAAPTDEALESGGER